MKKISIEQMRASFVRARAKAHKTEDLVVEYGTIYNFYMANDVSAQFIVSKGHVMRHVSTDAFHVNQESAVAHTERYYADIAAEKAARGF